MLAVAALHRKGLAVEDGWDKSAVYENEFDRSRALAFAAVENLDDRILRPFGALLTEDSEIHFGGLIVAAVCCVL